MKKIPVVYCVLGTIVVLVLFLFVLFSSHILNPTTTKKEKIAVYDNDVDYQVYLANNDFITNSFLGMNQSYISSMVDSVVVNYKQMANFSSTSSVDYDYTIYAKLSAVYHDEEDGDSVVWSKVYPLKQIDTQKKVGESLLLQEQVVVPYVQYLNDLNYFKSTYHLKVDTTLDVLMDINYQYSKNKNKNSQLKVSLPLGEDVFKITTNYKKNEVVTSTKTISNMILPTGLISLLLLVLGGVEVCLIGILSVKVLQLYSSTEYERIKHKIKKDYGSIIVDIDNTIQFDDFTIFEIKSIGEMVDLEEELRIPILFYEKKKAKISYFVIIKDHYMYRYTLRDTSQEIL